MEIQTPTLASADLEVRQAVSTVQREHYAPYLRKPESEWDWRDVRDYVVHQVEARSGAVTDSPVKLAGIFKRFCSTWGEMAPIIAQWAYTVEDGWWDGQPVGVTRFCKGCDPWFAQPIHDRILSAR